MISLDIFLDNTITEWRNEGKSIADLLQLPENHFSVLNKQFAWNITYDEFIKKFSDKKELALEAIYNVSILDSETKSIDKYILPFKPTESVWLTYLRKLEKKWIPSDLEGLKRSVQDIRNRISIQTNGEPIKGLVVGYVQSGKTANFAGVMALAADTGFNFFIVLSGMLEGLRAQTEERLIKDLRSEAQLKHNKSWINFRDKIRANVNNYDEALNNLDNDTNKYYAVVLKQVSRLRKLRNWLWEMPEDKRRRLKILIIDDEADQASINVNNEEKERSAINKLILEIVHGGHIGRDYSLLLPASRNADREKRYDNPEIDRFHSFKQFGSMNIVGYTGTPYANVLSESHENTLYPKDFIVSIEPSRYYFGSRRIFGTEIGEENNSNIVPSLGIIRIESNDKEGIDKLKSLFDMEEKFNEGDSRFNHSSELLPVQLTRAIAYYLCTASTFRLRNLKFPSSMLVHVSHKTNHQRNIRLMIEAYLKQKKEEIIEIARKVWNEEIESVTKEKFIKNLRTLDSEKEVGDTEGNLKEDFYPNLEDILDYPTFDEIEPGIRLLLEEPTRIFAQQSNDKPFTFKDSVMICEDNSNNRVRTNEETLRLFFPSDEQNQNSLSRAFIVVGGNTLSRGLTLQGLTVSYFLRTSTKDVDTLTQMARWFGHRQSYELLPRIWMSNTTLNYFQKICLSERSLREEIKRYAELGATPLDFAPRILTHPDSRLNPTARSKMRNAKVTSINFSGLNREVNQFPDQLEILKKNEELVFDFVNQLGKPRAENLRRFEANPPRRPQPQVVPLWTGIDTKKVFELIDSFGYSESQKQFSEGNRKLMKDWFSRHQEKYPESGLWNVSLSGRNPLNQGKKINDDISIYYRNLTYKLIENDFNRYYTLIRVRNEDDQIIDTVQYLKPIQKGDKNLTVHNIRKGHLDGDKNKAIIGSDLSKTPLLLIYCLPRTWEKFMDDGKNKIAPADLYSFYIHFPSLDMKEGDYIQLPLPEKDDYPPDIVEEN